MPTYRDHWPLLQSSATSWDRVASGNAALVSEQMARRMNLTLGDKVQVPTPNGNWTLEVAAIYADYGNPRGQLGVENGALLKHFPDVAQTRFGLRVTPAAVPQLIAELRRDFKLDDRSLADQAALKAESRKIFNRTFAVTNALNAFTLGIAGIALFTSLLTLSQSRLPQLAPLWALGLTRRKLALPRARQDHGDGADHRAVGAAARPAGGLVPDRGGQRQGVRLAAAVRDLSGATAHSCWRSRCWPRCWRRCCRSSS